MSTNTKDSQDKSESYTSKPTNALVTALAFCFYVLIGILLCYLKIVFGDLCRDEKMGYEKFVNNVPPNGPIEHYTTPSVFYYSNKDKKEYCKQLYVTKPNFIQDSTGGYSNSGKDQLLKTLFLETAYSIFGTINVLEDIPDWVIILFGPFLFGLMYVFSILFLWVMMSYHIFKYFTDPANLFTNKIIGWIVGFIVWMCIMCFFGFTATNIAFLYGFFRLFSIVFSSKTELVKVHFEEVTTPENKNKEIYSFGKYLLDMNGTSSVVHLLFIYGSYVALGTFGKQVAYSFLIIALIVFFTLRNQLQFVTNERLGIDGWTQNLSPINLNENKVVGGLVPKNTVEVFKSFP